MKGADAGRYIAIDGDAEMDEGNIYEALVDGWKQDVRNVWWIVDYNRQSLDGVVREGLPMMTLPSYPRTVAGRAYVLPYGPGARALLEDLRSGVAPAPRGTSQTRSQTTVVLYSGGRAVETEIVQDTLLTAGFRSLGSAGPGPSQLDALSTTTVYSVPEEEVRAAWVAAVLGAPLLPLPEGFRVPAGAQVVVAVGDDASS
jgi:hypothetical protein